MIAIANVFLTVLIGTFVYVGINKNSKKRSTINNNKNKRT